MIAALLSMLMTGLYTTLTFLLRAVLVEFVMFFALWYVTTEFIAVLKSASILPRSDPLTHALVGLPADVWFWLDLFAFSAGAPLIVSAFVTRFIIRRIPLIG